MDSATGEKPGLPVTPALSAFSRSNGYGSSLSRCGFTALQTCGDLAVQALADGVFEQVDAFGIYNRQSAAILNCKNVFHPFTQRCDPCVLHAHPEIREYGADSGKQARPVSGDDGQLGMGRAGSGDETDLGCGGKLFQRPWHPASDEFGIFANPG